MWLSQLYTLFFLQATTYYLVINKPFEQFNSVFAFVKLLLRLDHNGVEKCLFDTAMIQFYNHRSRTITVFYTLCTGIVNYTNTITVLVVIQSPTHAFNAFFHSMNYYYYCTRILPALIQALDICIHYTYTLHTLNPCSRTFTELVHWHHLYHQ